MVKQGSRSPRVQIIHRWVRIGFIIWTVFSTLWLANSVRTQGVDGHLLRSSDKVTVLDRPTTLQFLPNSSIRQAALVFFCGSGIAAYAYAPLLKPIAEAGFPVTVIKLPYRFAPFEAHKREAINRARQQMTQQPKGVHWIVSGHSLGGALAARLAHSNEEAIAALVLVGTTHPKKTDMSNLTAPVTKIYASHDGIAPVDRVMANRALLPSHTEWAEIDGGNHSQFGHYGHQLLDGDATISRQAQQSKTRAILLEVLDNASRGH